MIILRFLLITLILNFIPLSAEDFSQSKVQYTQVEELHAKKSQHNSSELVQLSKWLEQLQLGLHEVSEIDTIWIGGGSARAILDHIYYDGSLTMRDLDVFAINNQEVTEELVAKIGAHLETEDFGYFSRRDLRNRPRVPSDKPILTRNDYVAGYGLHWLRDNGEILDLSVYHSKQDLDLNGIFDVDTIMIPLRKDFSLVDFVKLAEQHSYEELVAKEAIYDRYQGYQHWREGSISIINWLDIEADPLLKLPRVIRTLFKNKRYTFTEEEERNFRYLLEHSEVKNSIQMTRSLLKVLEDERATQELALLKKMGFFDKWLSPFSHLDFEMIDLSKAEELDYGRGNGVALGRLYYLINQLPTMEQRLEAIYTTTSPYDLNLLLAWMHKELTDELIFVDNSDTLSPSRLRKIAMSSVLSKSERRDLLLSEIAGKWAPRRGVITGIFNPVHRGHMAFFSEAIEEMALDELIIIPHEGEPIYESPINWKDRWNMLKLVEKDIEELRIVSKESLPIDADSTDDIVSKLIKENSSGIWVRVIGTDAFKSYMGSKHLDKELADYVFVIQRGQEPLYPVDNASYRLYFKAHVLSKDSDHRPHQAKNARQLARDGKNPSTFVPNDVADYIMEQKLYRESKPLYCVTTNASKFSKVQSIEPDAGQISVDLPIKKWQKPKEVVEEKLQEALVFGKFPLIVVEQFIKIETISPQYIPLSDKTLETLGSEKIAALIQDAEHTPASIMTLVGYASDSKTTQILEHVAEGKISTKYLTDPKNTDLREALTNVCEEDGLEILLRNVKAKKVGVITGVFNPVHLGHLEALKAAKKEADFDKIVVIPTVATQHNESPIDWEARREMLSLALKKLDGIEVVSQHYRHYLENGTNRALDKLMKCYPNADIVHIMGSDSFERFEKRGFLENISEDKYSILVIQRPGYEITGSKHPKVSIISLKGKDSSQERASSIIRRLLQEGYPINHLVPPEVEKFINEQHLYVNSDEETAVFLDVI